jgi:2-C-methyl-D-erythritol 4-phosphate cytidylyltransferase
LAWKEVRKELEFYPMTDHPRFFAVMPAAGTGSRVGAAVPKQYLEIAGATILEWALRALLRADWLEQVLLVVAPDDHRAATATAALQREFGERLQVKGCGGATRRDSVLAGMEHLARIAKPDDWILVHDAARPGLTLRALERLRQVLQDDPVGGLLALPVADTIKHEGGDGRVARTQTREGLWQAQTPQMFRFGMLRSALDGARDVTDEASAIELAVRRTKATIQETGQDEFLRLMPKLVLGELVNVKVTTAGDLELMRQVLGSVAIHEQRQT